MTNDWEQATFDPRYQFNAYLLMLYLNRSNTTTILGL